VPVRLDGVFSIDRSGRPVKCWNGWPSVAQPATSRDTAQQEWPAKRFHVGTMREGCGLRVGGSLPQTLLFDLRRVLPTRSRWFGDQSVGNCIDESLVPALVRLWSSPAGLPVRKKSGLWIPARSGSAAGRHLASRRFISRSFSSVPSGRGAGDDFPCELALAARGCA